MSRAELVNCMAEEAGITKADATRALDAMQKCVEKGLKESGKVTLTGFCTFTVKNKPATTGRNPKTGETVQIAAKNAVTIKAGSKLKDALN